MPNGAKLPKVRFREELYDIYFLLRFKSGPEIIRGNAKVVFL